MKFNVIIGQGKAYGAASSALSAGDGYDKIVANLEYIDTLNMNHTFQENNEIEFVVYSLKEITSKIRKLWV